MKRYTVTLYSALLDLWVVSEVTADAGDLSMGGFGQLFAFALADALNGQAFARA